MRLSDSVTVQDVGEAVRLMQVAMQQSSVDPRTGQIDMDLLMGGVSAADRAMKAQLTGELRALLEQKARRGSKPACLSSADVDHQGGRMLVTMACQPCVGCWIVWMQVCIPQPPCAAPRPLQAGPNGLRIADVLDSINAQSSVRVSERDLRQALNELVRLGGGGHGGVWVCRANPVRTGTQFLFCRRTLPGCSRAW